MTPSPPTSSPAIYCRHCSYDLRATSARCPECGRVFDPSNPRTFRRHPRGRWLRHVKHAAYALLTLTLLLAAIWGWFFWGWYDEQQALRALPTSLVRRAPLSWWLREHAGPPGFVLDRVYSVDVIAGSAPLDLAPLVRVKKLEWLNLSGSSITDLRPLAGCMNLRRLVLRDTAVTDITPLAKLESLEWLDVPRGITDLRPVAGLRNLSSLWLPHTGVTDLAPVAGLTKLYAIYLPFTRVSDLRPLMRLPNLREVLLPDQTITEEQADELRRALPGCTVVRN